MTNKIASRVAMIFLVALIVVFSLLLVNLIIHYNKINCKDIFSRKEKSTRKILLSGGKDMLLRLITPDYFGYIIAVDITAEQISV